MNKFFIYSFMSLDGYMSDLGGDMEWVKKYPCPDNNCYDFEVFYRSIDCIVANRPHYTTLRTKEIHPINREKPVHIFGTANHTIPDGGNISSVITYPRRNSNFIEVAKKLRDEANGDLWLSGNQDLISRFIEHDLVDEITINVLPVTLGNGYLLFNPNSSELCWKLTDLKRFDNGVVQLKYIRNR